MYKTKQMMDNSWFQHVQCYRSSRMTISIISLPRRYMDTGITKNHLKAQYCRLLIPENIFGLFINTSCLNKQYPNQKEPPLSPDPQFNQPV